MRKQVNTNPQLVYVSALSCQSIETRNETVARPELVGLASSNRWGYDLQKGDPRSGAVRP